MGNPAHFIKRAPEPKILYMNDIVLANSSSSMEKRTVTECQAVNAVVGALKVVSKVAYPFCSTYISIPVQTSTVSSTITVTPAPVSVTATVTPPAVLTTVTTTTTTSLSGSASTIYSHYTPSAAKEKRAAPTLPPYLSAFAASQVSQACSCLSIPAKVTTTTTTVSTTLPAQTITTTATAATFTNTVNSTSTVTVGPPASTLPALCAPSAISLTSGALSVDGNDFPTIVTKSGITDITSCCAACLGTQSCASYYIDSGTCKVFIAVDKSSPSTGNAAQAAICPLGVDASDTIFPAGVSAPESGDGAFHVGPCLSDATALI